MPTSKRARAYARRRQSEWEARQRRRAAAQRRRAVIAAAVIGTLVLGTAAGALVLANQPSTISSVAAADEGPAVYAAPPPPADAESRAWSVTLATSAGDLAIELDGAAAPQAVASFLMLARDGYYDGTPCHRLVVGTLIQCGDPTGTGLGGPGYAFGPIENAPEDMTYPAGTVAMARRAGDGGSQGSQFFVTLTDTVIQDDSAGGYTVLGRVTGGLDVLTPVDVGGTVDGGPDGLPALPLTIEGVVIS